MTLTSEYTQDIEGFEGLYSISNSGSVKSIVKGIILSPIKHSHGYLKVVLYKKGKRHNVYVHRLIAAAFLTPVPGCNFINHKDGNPANNSIENLEWVTHQQNIQHAYHTLNCNRVRKVTDEIRSAIIELNNRCKTTSVAIGNVFDLSSTTVSRVIKHSKI